MFYRYRNRAIGITNDTDLTRELSNYAVALAQEEAGETLKQAAQASYYRASADVIRQMIGSLSADTAQDAGQRTTKRGDDDAQDAG